ncbi:hypothetical protein SteCoe_16763 [Stentor coeruleus]|uniref:J domain-containing protein n=1 Tax=Stentor coeruleus TaxID=5963 RepID=A0A1R2C0I0_9CILI|nr:hypothetical protein SteCoe_16763 [Stentor coeruleus]
MSLKNHYQVLSVHPNSTDRELKIAYHKLALKWHPDKNLSNKVHAEEQFKNINKAYSTLSNPEKRMMYDLFGASEENTIECKTSQYEEQSIVDFFKKYESFNDSFQYSTKTTGVKRKRSRSRSRFNQDFEQFFNDLFTEELHEQSKKPQKCSNLS